MMIEGLEKMLAKGVDNALLRFGLGKGYLDAGDAERAAEHLQRCVEQDPKYSAGWKLLGKARQAAGVVAAAQGIVTQLQKVVERRPAVVDGLGEQAIVALQRSGAGDQVLRRQVVLPLAGVVALLQAGLAIAADRPQVARLAFQQAAQRSHQQALGNAAIRVVDTCIQGGKPGTGKRQRSEAPARRL